MRQQKLYLIILMLMIAAIQGLTVNSLSNVHE